MLVISLVAHDRQATALQQGILTPLVKELDSLSKVLVVDELTRRQTLARPAALSPAVVVVSFFTAQFLQAGAQQQAVFTTRLGTSPQMEHLSGEIVPPLEHPLS